MYKKGRGRESRLAFPGHTLMDNRYGLLVDIEVTQASGTGEREAALAMVDRARRRGVQVVSVGADKEYDTREFIASLDERNIQPHVARNALVQDGQSARVRSLTRLQQATDMPSVNASGN